ncbi:MAG: hypothetical protein V4695_02745 [Pseudomonadota bacterium]
MSEIELVVPFCLPPVELAADLLRGLELPALASLLSRSKDVHLENTSKQFNNTHESDVYARSLPHEQWLARRFGMDADMAAGGSAPVATLLLKLLMEPKNVAGLQDVGHWFIVQPVHLHIARDHLVLTDTRQLALPEADSRILFESAATCFTDAGMTLHYGGPDYWFVRADQHRDLRTATPDAACGRNIDIWMPQGDSARSWRKLQNEIQMDWHTHAVNESRSAAGLVPINSVWLWGGCSLRATSDGAESTDSISSTNSTSSAQPVAIFNFTGWLEAFATLASSSQPNVDAATVINHTAPHRLVWLDALAGPALAGDWAEWRSRLQAIEAQWFVPMRQALTDNKAKQISLILTKSDDLRCYTASRASLKKFWVKPTLARLSS